MWSTKTTKRIPQGSANVSIPNGCLRTNTDTRTTTGLQLGNTTVRTLEKDVYLQRAAERLRNESASIDETDDANDAEREPIQRDRTRDDEQREAYLQQILSTDKNLDVNQIYGADHVVNEQEQKS